MHFTLLTKTTLSNGDKFTFSSRWFYPLDFFSYLNSSERASISLFYVECQTRELLVPFLLRLWYDAVLDWGLNPGPPTLEACTLPLGNRGGFYMILYNCVHLDHRLSSIIIQWRSLRRNCTFLSTCITKCCVLCPITVVLNVQSEPLSYNCRSKCTLNLCPITVVLNVLWVVVLQLSF